MSTTSSPKLRTWFASGEPFIWLNASATAVCLILVFGLILLIASRGLVHFWPAPLHEFTVEQHGQSRVYAGQLHEEEIVDSERLRASGLALPPDVQGLITQYLYKIGNRRLNGSDFVWIPETQVSKLTTPPDLYVLERTEWGNFHGRIHAVEGDLSYAELDTEAALDQALRRASALRDDIRHIEKNHIGAINYEIEQLRLERRGLELTGELDDSDIARLDAARYALESEFADVETTLADLHAQLLRDSVRVETADKQSLSINLAEVLDAYRPNAMSLGQKLSHHTRKMWEFVSTDPREANTEGGVFPAIFGTVVMVFIMAILVTPLGVVAAVYLREYAKQGYLTRLIRVAINNLAGVPSIVYGVFGLGFFVYFLGGNIDALFYPEALPAPTFGTPGLMWAAITLALLTLPVVIVATEEGLARIPNSIREGCLALGATRAETLWRVIIPMSSPAIMTGLILAIARAAGEVAPLMMVGVVKLAPTLAVDANAPYLHLDRKFMHLGFHIYDVGFQSPNVEAARPLVFATALLLILVILLLNLSAIYLRNRLRENYRMLEN